eukprot:s612_g16.t1
MWWNEYCLAWQIHGPHGEHCSWEEAVQQAHELKARREREVSHELGDEHVRPARSLQHRKTQEHRSGPEEPEHEGSLRESKTKGPEATAVPSERAEEGKKRRRKEKKRRPRSPSPDARPDPRDRRRRPPSSDDEDRDEGPAKRRGAPEEVWIKVPRPQQRRMLKRLSTLLMYGQWGATPLDLPPHPKIHGMCLIPASYEEVKEWEDCTEWSKRYLCPDLLLASKWLNILAWHFSTRGNRGREFAWCRTAAWLLREARRCLLCDNRTEKLLI